MRHFHSDAFSLTKLHKAGNQARLLGLQGAHCLRAQEHVRRPVFPDDSRQSLRSDCAKHGVQGGLRIPKRRAFRGKDYVAHLNHLAAFA